jgi:GTP:adenosylcobinamide-phosphate guanylyltransferase
VIKTFIHGAVNPASIIDAGLVMLDSLSIDSIAARVDSRYDPIVTAHFRKQQRSATAGRIAFWGVLIVGFALLVIVKAQAESANAA